MILIGQCKPCASTAPVAKVPPHPNGVHSDVDRRRQVGSQVPAPERRRILSIMHGTHVGIGIEDIAQAEACEGFNKNSGSHGLCLWKGREGEGVLVHIDRNDSTTVLSQEPKHVKSVQDRQLPLPQFAPMYFVAFHHALDLL